MNILCFHNHIWGVDLTYFDLCLITASGAQVTEFLSPSSSTSCCYLCLSCSCCTWSHPLVSDRCWCRTSDTGASAVIGRIGDKRATALRRPMCLSAASGLRCRSGCNWLQPDTSPLCARGGHKMPCMTAPLCGECNSLISGQWAPLQFSRWPSYDAPRPAINSVCNPIPVVRSCYAVWFTSPRPPVHWQTADHGNGMVEEAQSSADSTAQASSVSLLSAKRPKLARPATDDSFVLNALGPLLNAGTSHSPSSTIAAPAAKPVVNWWRENERGFPNVACVAVTAMF